MDDLTLLTRPLQPNVTVDFIAKDCSSEGFNYPVFRQLNKKARVYLSKQLNLKPSICYRLFAVANSKGWFAAVQAAQSGISLVFSTLEDLRSAFAAAKEDGDSLFSPKRILSIPTADVNIITFACGDSFLFLGLENGFLAVYDTAALFTPGTDEITPLKTAQVQSSPPRQILPNPGTEPNLRELVAVVGDGKVTLLNMQLEAQGGWAASDLMTQPITASWSPKGKHIAIGLQTGDVLTFSLANKSTPNKHIPPTADAILVSLNWLGPGHTFRTTYAAQADSPAKQHIATLDTKSSTVTYVSPDHPFPANDRTQQNAYILNFQKWDVDAALIEENRSLVVVGDFSSVDLEILGNMGNQWFRQSQDNPLTLPLDKSTDDTILLSLEADLTDTTVGAPLIYAYLNDGSLQGWHAEHTKRYVGLISSGASSSTVQGPSQSQEPKDSDMATESAMPSLSTFGQSSFNQPASVFGGGQQTTVFGKTGFGGSSFGQPSFGQPSFGQPAFGQGAFGQTNQANNNANSAFSSAKPDTGFGAFVGSGLNAFGSGGGSGSSSSNAFSAFGPAATSQMFSQGTFPPTNTNSSDNVAPTITQEASMSDADATPGFGGLSLGSTTTADSKAVNSMFGSFGTPTATSQQTGSHGVFGGGGDLVKPATGFGAFGGFKTSSNFDHSAKPVPSVNAFSSFAAQTPTISSGFGQSGQSGFGHSAFGQATFGKTGFGGIASATTASSPIAGGFSAFANAPASSTSTSQSQQSTGFGTTESKPTTSGGFASFASVTPVAFGSPASMAPTTAQPKPPSGGFSSFASTTPTAFSSQSSNNTVESPSPAFASTTLVASDATSGPSSMTTVASKPSLDGTVTRTSVFGTAFGGTSSASSPFGVPAEAPSSHLADTEKFNGSLTVSPPSSPEFSKASPPSKSATPAPPPTPAVSGGAFVNIQTTPSAFKPAAGFGAFGSTTPKDSPFFKRAEQTPPALSAFAPISPTTTPSTPRSTTATPSFGSVSVLGVQKAHVVPAVPSPTSATSKTTPSTGGAFAAFGGSSTPFTPFANSKKSFSDLLKTGEGENEELEKRSSSSTPTQNKKEGLQQRISVFGTPKADEEQTVDFSDLPRDEERKATKFKEKEKEKEKSPGVEQEKVGKVPEELSSSNVSVSSAGSSFVEITQDAESSKKDEDEDEVSDQDADHHDDGSEFLTDEDDLLGGDAGSDEDCSLPEGDEEEDESEDSSTPSPVSIPLPASRSTSVTPQPEFRKIEVFDVKPSAAREPSTTPPGSPFKEAKSLSGISPFPTSSAGPFGIGLGRPSTRPARSSPLANAVVVGADAGSELQETTPPFQSAAAGSLPTPPPTTPSSSCLSSDNHRQNLVLAPPPPPFTFGIRPPANPPEGLFRKPLDSHASAPTLLSTAHAATASTTSPSPSQSGLFPARLSNGPTNVFGSTSAFGSEQAASNLFGMVPKGSAPLNSQISPQIPQGTSGAQSIALVISAKIQEEENLEEGMQKECVTLVRTIEKDMEELATTAANARHIFAGLNMCLGGSRNKADLGNPAKWGLADLKQFGALLLQYQSDLQLLEVDRDREKQSLREIKSNILKAGTRREEIARFNKAKDDKEFAKMLKARTLGPEHSETQTQLRKSIRTIRDRVQKLEKRLQDDKKKLADAQSCKPRIKAPSLDTINRTYRNIAIAVEQQTDDINRLATMISKINIADTSALTSTRSLLLQRDSRLPDLPGPRKPINITPNVAVTTAAALNAERSAHRLKKALLAIRKEPLLNTKAAAAPGAPLAFKSPSKPGSGAFSREMSGFEGLKGSLFSEPLGKVPELDDEDWHLPEDHFDPSGSHSNPGGSGSGRREKAKRGHRGGSALRRSPAPESANSEATGPTTTTALSSASAPVSFDWGPLPTFASPSSSKSTPFVPIFASPTAANTIAGGAASSPSSSLPKGFVPFVPLSSPSPSPEISSSTNANPKGSLFEFPSNLSKGWFTSSTDQRF